MGDISKHFFKDGREQHTDEDGKPVGKPFNPNDLGGEDLPHRLSGKPLQEPKQDAPPARGMVQSDGYIHGGNGAYYSPSAYHTGEDTAAANGVDVSSAEDDSMDGM